MDGQSKTSDRAVLLLTTANSYRTRAFADVAADLGATVHYGVEMDPVLGRHYRVPLPLRFAAVDEAVEAIGAFAEAHPLHAILAVDDSATLLASHAAAALGLKHNAPRAALAARNKFVMRGALAAGGIPVPWFRRVAEEEPLAPLAEGLPYPVVVKPLLLSGSRGVIRANDPASFVAAGEWVRAILRGTGVPGDGQALLVEAYLPGIEVAYEGLLVGGRLHRLALFDKPDPLEGPFFEETIYLTPSRLLPDDQAAIHRQVAAASRALGLQEGPVHAELRLNEKGPWLIEIAGRSIGGHCGSILAFGSGLCLEEVILRHALDLPLPELEPTGEAAGVMMIPIPKQGMLRAVEGVEEAEAVAGVTGVEISAPLNHPILPLPEGESYLGFIFARGTTPSVVERALRTAHGHLRIEIEDTLRVLPA